MACGKNFLEGRKNLLCKCRRKPADFNNYFHWEGARENINGTIKLTPKSGQSLGQKSRSVLQEQKHYPVSYEVSESDQGRETKQTRDGMPLYRLREGL